MKYSRKLATPTDVVEDVFCNKCGLSCKSPQGHNHGLIEAEVVGGYESTHIGDGDVHKFSLCERCLLDMINEFHYPSFQGNYITPDDDNQVEGFDPHQYWGEGVYLPGDPEFTELCKVLENDVEPLSFDNMVLEVLPDEITPELDLDDDDLDSVLDRLPRPKRIKKEDMN